MYRVLYVDDDPDLLKLGQMFLGSDGTFCIDTLSSANVALGQLKTKRYDAIVSDYQMPGMDGITFLKEIRAAGNTTPFIIFTGRSREEVVIEALNSGADFYLQKGGEPDSQFTELAYKIHHAISRKQADLALKRREQEYQQLIEHANEAIFIVQDERFRAINPRSVELSGYAEEDLLSQPFIRFVHPEDRDTLLDRFRKRMMGEPISSRHMFRFNRKDGAIRWVELNAILITWRERPATLNFLIDVTENKIAGDAIRESEERFREFFETTLDSVFITTEEGKFIDFNDALMENLGCKDREETFSLNVADTYAHPEERKTILDLAKEKGHINEHPLQFKKRDGTVFDTLVTMVPHKNADGSIKAFIGTVRNITGWVQAEAALKMSEARYRNIFESFEDLYYQIDLNGVITILSPSLYRLTGWQPEELIGKPVTDIYVNPESRRDLLEEIAKTGYVRDYEVMLLKKDGTQTPVSLSANRICNPSGEPSGFSGVIRDITERKRAECALRNANKKLNLLSSITRHDVSNQLAGLRLYLALLEKTQVEPRSIEYLRRADDAAEQINVMIGFTKEYEEVGITVPSWQDVSRIVDTVAKEVPSRWVTVKNDIPAGTEVFADPLIAKVFYNLIDNAVRYGGKITTIRFSVEERNGNQIIVCEDNGVGVPAGDKELLFNRGFGKNTGLGLALSREILDISGITIRENGEPGEGARFEMAVPAGCSRIIADKNSTPQ